MEVADVDVFLAKLAAQKHDLSTEQSNQLRQLLENKYGPPHETHGRGCTWRFDTEDAHGEVGLLKVFIPHDNTQLATVSFTPPDKGTWIDESEDFSQENFSSPPLSKPDDPTGGKAIARKLLQTIKSKS